MPNPLRSVARPLSVAFLLAFSCVPVHSAPLNVAVSDLIPRGVDSSSALIVSDRLRSELLNTGRFRVMERGQMDQILKEQVFQQSGACDQSECAVQIGKLLSVDRMIVGSVGRLGEVYTLQARILDVGTGEIVFTANQDFEGRIDGLLSQSLPKLATRLALATRTDSVGGKADLFVDVNEPGSDVYLDGVKKGLSPLTLSGIPAGDHRVEARKGDLYGMMDVELRPDDVHRLALALEIGMGSVKIFTEPVGAEVRLDIYQSLGTTPLKADRIPVGRHELFISHPGYIPQLCSLNVRPNEMQTLKLAMVPGLPVKILVPVAGLGVFVNDSSDTTRSFLPDSPWLSYGKWTLSVDAGKDWNIWSGALNVTSITQTWTVDLVHSRSWNDSVALARHRATVVAWRWTLGLATLAAAGGATFFHVKAAQAEDDADKAASDYDAMSLGGDFTSAKSRYDASVDDNKTFSRNALIADIGVGVLLSGFILTYVF